MTVQAFNPIHTTPTQRNHLRHIGTVIEWASYEWHFIPDSLHSGARVYNTGSRLVINEA